MIYTSPQALITVKFVGLELDFEPWDLWEDGQKKAESLKLYPGGMEDGFEAGNTPTREPLKIGRKWADIFINHFKEIESFVGYGEIEASRTTLNRAKQPVGSPITLSGLLLQAGPVNYKAGPAEELMFMLEIGTNVKAA